MKPTHLLPLLASLQMLPRPGSPEAWLSAPELIVSPQYHVFLRGESVALTCSASSNATVSRIWFFRDGQRMDSGAVQRSQYHVSASLLLLSVSESHAGVYSCGYWKTESGREIPSERSRPISITVTVRPSAPKLTVSPERSIFLRGESMTLTCSAPRTATVSGIQFFKDGQIIGSRDLQWSQDNVRSLQVWSVSDSEAGLYSCESWRTESGREIPSERSRHLSIAVTDSFPAPQLTVSPLQPVYIAGEAVTLKCSAIGSPTMSGIRFYRDSQEIQSKEFPSSRENYTVSLPLWSVFAGSAGEYSCESWHTVSGQKIKSARSQPSSIRVTARPPPPSLSLDPPQPIYIRGEPVTLRCSAPMRVKVAGYRFFNQSGEQISSGVSSQGTWQISASDAAASQAYTCLYWRVERGREIPSEKSPPVPVSMTDPPPQPELSVDSLSGAVSKGFSLNITCTVPGDARERRFHFYKDGVELVPGNLGSEISTMKPAGSVNVSVFSIPLAGPNITGEFACGYEENMAGRWIPSPRRRAGNIIGNVTMSAHGFRWVRELTVGGSFFLINGLIFHISHCYF